MSHTIGFICDPIHTLNPQKDSTMAMMHEAQSRGWSVAYIDYATLALNQDGVSAKVDWLDIHSCASPWYTIKKSTTIHLNECSAVLMRKDPPFDLTYLYATQMLSLCEQQGTLCLNPSKALRDFNEKLAILSFPDLIPETLVTSHKDTLVQFTRSNPKTVFKPLHSMGGDSIFALERNSNNLHALMDAMTQKGAVPIMAQRYIPDITQGDKRVLIIDGEPVPQGLKRIPTEGDFRGNLAVGGRSQGFELNKTELELAGTVGRWLKAQGIIFAGIDVIGDKLTEINITSPTCVREIDAAFGLNLSKTLMDKIAALID